MELVTIYLNINRDFQDYQLKEWTEFLFDISKKNSLKYFNYESKILGYINSVIPGKIDNVPIELKIIVEEGSVKSWIKISIIPAFIFYGSIRSSIDYLISDAKNISKTITENVISTKNVKTEEIKGKRITVGTPDKLLKLFNQVKKGNVTPEQATRKAMELLGDNYIVDKNINLSSKLMHEFSTSFDYNPKTNNSHHKIDNSNYEKLHVIKKQKYDDLTPISSSERAKRRIILEWDSQSNNRNMTEY